MSMKTIDIQNFYNADNSQLKDFSYEMISTVKPASNEPQEIDGIEILYNMAKAGKIDPWNIDLTDLADKYLLEVSKLKSVNLKHTGRTILFLSVLLRLKSNILDGIDISQFEDNENTEDNFDDDDFEADYDVEPINKNNVISIDEVLQRRTSVRLNRNRVVTLKDLIRQLEFYEQLDKKMELKNQLERQKKRLSSHTRFSTRHISDIYQDNYMKTAIPKMKENLDRIFEQETKVELNTLTLLGFSKVTAYLALLFISTEAKYEITQEKFYDKLYVEKAKIEDEIKVETA